MDKICYTIGHSNHSKQTFLDLLKQARIEVLVDVRSNPNSKWAEFADKGELKHNLIDTGIQYLYLGDLLGGHPSEPECYNQFTKKVDYATIKQKESFRSGIERLLIGIDKYRVCIMCAEEDPSHCHRNLLISDQLRKEGVKILHIRGNGKVQTDEELWKEKTGVSSEQSNLV